MASGSADLAGEPKRALGVILHKLHGAVMSLFEASGLGI
jgi:hypothetical protein